LAGREVCGAKGVSQEVEPMWLQFGKFGPQKGLVSSKYDVFRITSWAVLMVFVRCFPLNLPCPQPCPI
jgi:hypothetical protein